MKKILLTLFIGCNLILGNSILECKSSADKQIMAKLISDIINSPTRMIQIMNNSETIDCTYLVDLLREDSRLIEFTLDIAYLKCSNYKYDGIEEKPVYGSDEKSFYVYYIKGEGVKSEDFVKFKFQTEGDKVVFKGIPKPID